MYGRLSCCVCVCLKILKSFLICKCQRVGRFSIQYWMYDVVVFDSWCNAWGGVCQSMDQFCIRWSWYSFDLRSSWSHFSKVHSLTVSTCLSHSMNLQLRALRVFGLPFTTAWLLIGCTSCLTDFIQISYIWYICASSSFAFSPCTSLLVD